MAWTLWIRADGSPAIGLGHLSRTSAIAETARAAEVTVRYVTVVDDLAASFFERRRLHVRWTEHATALDWLADVVPGDAVVFDRYDLEEAEVAAASAAGAAVAMLDDHGRPVLPVDLVVNPNDDVDSSALPPSTAVLSGPSHALVRAAFTERRRARSGEHRCIVITMGGSDIEGRGGRVAAAVAGVGCFDDVVLVEGPGAVSGPARRGIEIVRDPPEIAEVFDRADAAITAGGATCWELLAMGIPTAATAISDNQRGVVRRAAGAGAIRTLGADLRPAEMVEVAQELATPASQRRLSERALELVDGNGPARVLDALEALRSRG